MKIKSLKEAHAKLAQHGLNFYACNRNTDGKDVTNGGTYVVYDTASEADENGNHTDIWTGDRKALFGFAEQLISWTAGQKGE